jgi:hypothetical protein
MSILKEMLSRFRLGAVAAVVALSASPASAAEGSFSFPPQAAFVSGSGAKASVNVNLPASGTSGFFVDFVLPPDYVANGRVRIVLYITDAVGGCTARLVAHQLVRRRAGAPSVNSLSGLSEGNPTVALAGFTVVPKVIALQPGAQPVGQLPGDAIVLEVIRQADDMADTCDRIFIQAIDIRYPRQ